MKYVMIVSVLVLGCANETRPTYDACGGYVDSVESCRVAQDLHCAMSADCGLECTVDFDCDSRESFDRCMGTLDRCLDAAMGLTCEELGMGLTSVQCILIAGAL